jgi:ABC-type Zn uptake system ZnuABC Zn-binding protein ZnuA
VAGCSESAEPATDGLVIATTVSPLTSIAANIAGALLVLLTASLAGNDAAEFERLIRTPPA